MDKLLEIKNFFNINKETLDNLFYDLEEILKVDSRIVEIGVDGGAMTDIIYGIEPKDFDLRYVAIKDGIYITNCICDEIKNKINQIIGLRLMVVDKIDLNNINENKLLANCETLKESVNSIYSPNSCFNNIAIFTSDRQFLASDITFDAIVSRKYVPNFLGYMSYYHSNFLHEQYYEVIFEMLVRGVSYLIKRNLVPDDEFVRILKEYPKLTESIEPLKHKNIIKLKFKNVEEFESYIKRYI